ncbi:MAG TPA: hypothetical protein VLL97_11270 [Acidobacteriota bacterium]|nr:hypothetical protein [Acidobacteriota bacterium]
MRKLLLAAAFMIVLPFVAFADDHPEWEVFGGYSLMKADLDTGVDSFDFYDWYYGTGDTNFQIGSGTNTGFVQGFDVALVRNVNSWLGVKGSFSSHFGAISLDDFDVSGYRYFYAGGGTDYDRQFTNQFSGKADYRRFTGLFGPEFSYRNNSRVRPFAHVLFGFSKVTADGLNLDAEHLRDYEDSGGEGSNYDYRYTGVITGKMSGNTGFAMALGGGLDVKAGKHLSLRVIQLDYLPTWNRIQVNEMFDGAYYYQGTLQRYLQEWQTSNLNSRFNNMKLTFGVVINFR